MEDNLDVLGAITKIHTKKINSIIAFQYTTQLAKFLHKIDVGLQQNTTVDPIATAN